MGWGGSCKCLEENIKLQDWSPSQPSASFITTLKCWKIDVVIITIIFTIRETVVLKQSYFFSDPSWSVGQWVIVSDFGDSYQYRIYRVCELVIRYLFHLIFVLEFCVWWEVIGECIGSGFALQPNLHWTQLSPTSTYIGRWNICFVMFSIFVWYLLIFVSYFFNVCLIIWQRNWLLFYVVRIVWLFYGGKLPGKIFVYVRTFGEYKTEIYVGKSFSLLDTELLRNGIYLFSYTNIFKVLYTSTRVTQQRNCTVVCFIINFFKNKSSKQYAPLQGAWEPYPKPFRSSSSLEGPSTWKTFAS